MSGLASLSATYTDSEGEDDHHHHHHRSGSSDKSVAILIKPVPKPTLHKPKNASNVAQLVSYHDDIVISDEEGEVYLNIQDEKDNDLLLVEETTEGKQNKESKTTKDSVEDKANQSDEDDIQLPPEPNGLCDVKLQEKILKYHKQMELSSNWDMNEVIQSKKNFRNPSIYEKLIQYCGINELGTNYPPSIYDPERWGKESFYEELSKAQKTEMEKREKEKKERAKVEIVTGTAKRTGTLSIEDIKNRKSKWDQVGGMALGVSVPGLLRPIGIMQQATLTSSGSGVKGTVISAFGSLPKRPKL